MLFCSFKNGHRWEAILSSLLLPYRMALMLLAQIEQVLHYDVSSLYTGHELVDGIRC